MDSKKNEIKISEIEKAFETLKLLNSKGLRDTEFIDDDGNTIVINKERMDKYYDSNLSRIELIATGFYKSNVDVYDITNPRELNWGGMYDLLKNGKFVMAGEYVKLQKWVKENANPQDLYLETRVSDCLALEVKNLR